MLQKLWDNYNLLHVISPNLKKKKDSNYDNHPLNNYLPFDKHTTGSFEHWPFCHLQEMLDGQSAPAYWKRLNWFILNKISHAELPLLLHIYLLKQYLRALYAKCRKGKIASLDHNDHKENLVMWSSILKVGQYI